MAIFPYSLVVEVSNILERFGIKASPEQVASLATFYWHKRSNEPAHGMAEAMIGVPRLPWPSVLNTTESQVEVMAPDRST